MGRNGFIICLSKGKLLELSAAKLNLLGKLSLFTYYKWHPSETLYINVCVEGFSQKEQSNLAYLHAKGRQTFMMNVLHPVTSLAQAHKARLCQGCSPLLRPGAVNDHYSG